MKGQVLFLGTGSSMGVPVIGCLCDICKSKDAFNKRLRPSVLLKVNSKNILVDVTPDFRQQALLYNIDRIDAVLLTHAHFDHIGGLDDLRIFYFNDNKPIKCFLSQHTYDELKRQYYYLFEEMDGNKTVSAQLDFEVINNKKNSFFIDGIEINYFFYHQKTMHVTGYRIGNMAYVSDIREYDDDILTHLKNLDVLILSALRFEPSIVHFSIEEATEFSKKVGAKKTYFTHIAHEIDHAKVQSVLEDNFFLSYDGLELDFNI